LLLRSDEEVSRRRMLRERNEVPRTLVREGVDALKLAGDEAEDVDDGCCTEPLLLRFHDVVDHRRDGRNEVVVEGPDAEN
jgi:hypothetical protein